MDAIATEARGIGAEAALWANHGSHSAFEEMHTRETALRIQQVKRRVEHELLIQMARSEAPS